MMRPAFTPLIDADRGSNPTALIADPIRVRVISRKSSAASPSATRDAYPLHELQPDVPNLDDLFGEGAGREPLGAVIGHLVGQRAEDDGDADARDDRTQQARVSPSNRVERQQVDSDADEPGADDAEREGRDEGPPLILDKPQGNQATPRGEHPVRDVEDPQGGEHKAEAEREDRVRRTECQPIE